MGLTFKSFIHKTSRKSLPNSIYQIRVQETLHQPLEFSLLRGSGLKMILPHCYKFRDVIEVVSFTRHSLIIVWKTINVVQ